MAKPVRAFAVFVLPLFLLSVACSGLGGPEVTEPPVDTDQTVLFSDDFSDPNSGWDRVEDSDGMTDYADGAYRIFVNTDSLTWWANPSRFFDDVQVEVDATKAGGPDDNGFGIVCRYQDTDNFYMLLISSDGYAAISKLSGGTSELLVGESWLESNAIRQGSSTNHMRADCVGDRLSLYANGELIASVTDGEFSSGDVGLVGMSFTEPGVDISFDDFVVLQQ